MKQAILIFFIFLLLGAVGYLWLKYTPNPGDSNSVSGQAGIRLIELRRLKTLKLDTSVLRDPFFSSLQIPPETTEQGKVSAGRVNPFLPF